MSRVMQRMWQFLGFGEHEEGGAPAETAPSRAPIFRLHTQRSFEIVVLEPGQYDEAQTAADYLKTHRPIVLNLRNAHKDLGRRVVDFLSGVAYALDGHMHRVGDDIFLFTPAHVSITAEHVREEAASGGLFPVD
ncbi:MAG TPA: cell division protein SepF [bacterium]|nr:cell division protein SepF [bacterium]